MVDYKSSLSVEEQVKHPEWVGKYRELKQLVQETSEEGIEVFV
jgi:hypothetical protein